MAEARDGKPGTVREVLEDAINRQDPSEYPGWLLQQAERRQFADAILRLLASAGISTADLDRLAAGTHVVVEKEAVAWRVKDFADGWVLTDKREIVDGLSAQGHAVQPLLARTTSEGVAT